MKSLASISSKMSAITAINLAALFIGYFVLSVIENVQIVKFLFYLLLMTAFILLVNFIVYVNIIKPMRSLSKKMTGVRVDVNEIGGCTEMRKITQAYNELVDEIDKDISELQSNQNALKLSSIVFDHSGDGIVITDSENNIVSANDAFLRMSGYQRGEIMGQNPRIFSSGSHDRDFYQNMWESIQSSGEWRGRILDRGKNGRIYEKFMSITALKDGDQIVNYVSIHGGAEGSVSQLAYYDILTGLPNRFLMHDRMAQMISIAKRHRSSFAIMFLDLDGFKVINDTHGHAAGDNLLKAVATRIKNTVRSTDTVCRIGGDEFVVILHDTSEDATLVAKKIVDLFSIPFTVSGHRDALSLYSNTSIGIACYPRDGRDSDQLIRNADIAMYNAKKSGKGRYKAYQPGMVSDRDILIDTERNIDKALSDGEFKLVYQPQCSVIENKICGIEALLRWDGMPTEQLIRVAELTGQIVGIGDFVIDRALSDMRQLMSIDDALVIAINVSAIQLADPTFVDRLKAVALHYGVPHKNIEVEITESAVIDDIAKIALSDIVDANFGLSIDDFGTGYSNLGYLSSMRATSIKIDKIFISGLDTDQKNIAIIQSVVHIAKQFGMRVIAEGVETNMQSNVIKLTKCDLIQGYYTGKPMPIDEIKAMITSATFQAP